MQLHQQKNLYPLSNDSSRYGQAVHVGYGIKTHSVGWSGVMTFDQMSLKMARINPMDVPSEGKVNVSGVVPRDPANRTREKSLTREETNVEFAAIMENNGFFGQECGVQHGIWDNTLSVDQKPTLFDTLSASMKIPNGFALQLCGRLPKTTKTTTLQSQCNLCLWSKRIGTRFDLTDSKSWASLCKGCRTRTCPKRLWTAARPTSST